MKLPLNEEGKQYIYYVPPTTRTNILQVELTNETQKSYMVLPKTQRSLLGSCFTWLPTRLDKKKYSGNVFVSVEDAWNYILTTAARRVEQAKHNLAQAKEQQYVTYRKKLAWAEFVESPEEAQDAD